jgi:hypothetical protein
MASSTPSTQPSKWRGQRGLQLVPDPTLTVNQPYVPCNEYGLTGTEWREYLTTVTTMWRHRSNKRNHYHVRVRAKKPVRAYTPLTRYMLHGLKGCLQVTTPWSCQWPLRVVLDVLVPWYLLGLVTGNSSTRESRLEYSVLRSTVLVVMLVLF